MGTKLTTTKANRSILWLVGVCDHDLTQVGVAV